MPFDTLLIEFEGVLADTTSARRDALRRSLADEGVELTDADYEKCCAGFPPREGALAATARRVPRLDETALDLVALRAERYFSESLGKGVSLAPGARELVTDVAEHSRLAIVTRARRREVDFVLGLAGLESAFEVVVTNEDVHAPKPSPEGYEIALQRLVQRRRISRPTSSIALEDSVPGILAARAVKIPVIAVGEQTRRRGVHADATLATLVDQSFDSIAALVARGAVR